MPLNDEAVALRAMEMLGLDETALPRLVSLIPNAKRKLALDVAASPRRDMLRKDFTLSPTSGAEDLSAADYIGAAEPLLLSFVRFADIRSASSSYKWQWVGNRSVMALQDSDDFFHFTVEGNTLYTNSTDASATMRASYEASLAMIETQGLDDELVADVVLLASGATEAEAA